MFVLGSAPLAGSAQEAPAYDFEADDELVIVGEVQKPEVTVVISRENLNKSYELELKESFVPKIVEACGISECRAIMLQQAFVNIVAAFQEEENRENERRR